MVIFHSYVSLPEGNAVFLRRFDGELLFNVPKYNRNRKMPQIWPERCSGWWFYITILKNDGVRQWEGLYGLSHI